MRFWLVGGGPDRDRTARRVERLGLRRPGFVWLADRDDPAGLWPAADVGVRYAEGQGSDVTALEAMAAGVALIAADAPQDLGSVVQPERTGLLVPPGSLDALVHAIGRLACDWPLRRRLGAAAALHVRDHHSDDHMAAAFERMVRSVLAPEPPFG